MEVLGADFIEDLLRFALLRSGNRRQAFEQVLGAVAEAEAQAAHWRTGRHRFIWAARLISQRLETGAQTHPEPGGPGELCEPLLEMIKGGSGQQRCVWALQSLGTLKLVEIARLLKVRPRELKPVLAEWHARLARLGLSEEAVRKKVAEINFSEVEREALASAAASPVVRGFGTERALGVAAVLLGVFTIFGYIHWERWRESEPVIMQGHLGRLLELNRSAGIAGLEKFHATLGEATDWLFLHGMEGVEVPGAFAHVKVSSARVMDWNGGKLAQLPLQTIKGLCIIAEADAVGFEGERSSFGRVQFREWSGAWVISGAHAFFLAVREGSDALDRLLQEPPGSPPQQSPDPSPPAPVAEPVPSEKASPPTFGAFLGAPR